MKQASSNVCLALSDDEDYVSFDEDDLNAGIQDLYDNDSAEDAASDVSNEEYHDSAVLLSSINANANSNSNTSNILSNIAPASAVSAQPFIPLINAAPPQPQQQMRSFSPNPPTLSFNMAPMPQSNSNAPRCNVNNTNATNHSNVRHMRSSSALSSQSNRYQRSNSRGGRGRGRGRSRNSYNRNRNNNNSDRQRQSMDDLSLHSLQKQHSYEKQKSPTKKPKIQHSTNDDNMDFFSSLNQINLVPPTLNMNRPSYHMNAMHAPPMPPMGFFNYPNAAPLPNAAPQRRYHSHSHAPPVPPPMSALNPMSAMFVPAPMAPPPRMSVSNLSMPVPAPMPPPSAMFVPSPSLAPVSAPLRKQHKLSKRIQKLNEMKAKKKRRKDRKIIHKQKINTNVISIELGTLAQSAENIATGDPIKCSNDKCGVILSKYDTLLKGTDEVKLDDEDERIWVCSFCNTQNIIEIDAEEMPTNETIDYILEPPNNSDSKENDSEEQKQIVFCIDISGSMCVTQPVQGKKFELKGNRLQKENDELSQFIDPNDSNQWMPNQSQNVTYISRLQSVQAAVDQQLLSLKDTNPNMKIGLVAFNNDVTVYGDAIKDNNHAFGVITGDKLNNIEKLREIGSSDEYAIKHKLRDSHKALSDALWNLEETGQTALGPALVTSISMASVKRGSQVILCTDGLANVGVGKIDGNDTDEIGTFYENLGAWAMEKGVVVSIISITDEGCNLEALGRIVEMTGGNLRRINPLKLTEKFSGILDKEIIAALTNAKMALHPGLKFIDTVTDLQNLNPFQKANESESETTNSKEKMEETDVSMEDSKEKESAENDKSERRIFPIPKSSQDVGNVFADTTIFFEYGIERENIKRHFKDLKSLPFQCMVHYTKLDGSKMLRVITQMKEVTYDKKQRRENLDFSILSKFGTRVTTKLCGVGDYEASRAFTNANSRYMHSNANNLSQMGHLASYVNSNVGLDYQMQQQQQTEVRNYNQSNHYNHGYSPALNNNCNNWIARSEQINTNSASVPSAPAPPQQPSHYQQTKPEQNTLQQQSRRSVRSDKFSSNCYGMKRKY